MKLFKPLLAALCLSVLAAAASPSMTVALFLKSNGTDIQGESTIASMGRANSIECLSFEGAMAIPRDAATGQARGRRTYEPIVIRKRIDKSSPLLARALCNNEIVEGAFRLYRPSADGTTQHFFTIEFKSGRVSSHKLYVPDTIVPATSTQPPLEEVSFVFSSIKWRYEIGGVEFQDNNGVNRIGEAAPLGAKPRLVPPPVLFLMAPELASAL